jgi:cathepsin L
MPGRESIPVPEEETETFSDVGVPSSIDWKARGGVSAIRGQRCGDCYTFSAISQLESEYWKKTGKLVAMSEQQLVDCSSRYGFGNGCNGGIEFYAYSKFLNQVSAVRRETYAYANGRQQTCQTTKGTAVTKTPGGYQRITAGEDNLRNALASRATTIALEASSDF